MRLNGAALFALAMLALIPSVTVGQTECCEKTKPDPPKANLEVRVAQEKPAEKANDPSTIDCCEKLAPKAEARTSAKPRDADAERSKPNQ